jgi:hypothetical protein
MNNFKMLISLLAVCVISCSKKEDEPAEIKTYGIVVNNSPANLEQVLVGYFDNNAGKTVLINSLGNIAANTSSVKFEVSNEKVIPELFVYFHQGEGARIVIPAFKLFRHTDNSFILNDDNVSDAYNVEKSGPHYPH